MPQVHRARWVLPIVAPPIRDGWIAVDRGRIVALGGRDDPVDPEWQRGLDAGAAANAPARVTGAIMPGLVNAHAHLELSWMRGQVPPAGTMAAWASRLMALRRTVGSEPPEPIVEAVLEARSSGTALIGDVTNTLASYAPLADSPLSAMIFRELLGFNTIDPVELVRQVSTDLADLTPVEWLRTSIVPHAPYSVSPQLFQAIAACFSERPLSVHLGESAEEVEFLHRGTGAWRSLLEELGVWTPAWSAPGCGPVEYLERLGVVSSRVVAVHGVQLTESELVRLAAAGATVVTCPRSNRWTGAGEPPVSRFYASGVRVAIGTDSLASVDDLNMFNEMAAVRALAPDVGASRILRSATLDGAVALGFGEDLGSLEPGKRAELLGVAVPPDVVDVEEYLLGGIDPRRIRWLEAE